MWLRAENKFLSSRLISFCSKEHLSVSQENSFKRPMFVTLLCFTLFSPLILEGLLCSQLRLKKVESFESSLVIFFCHYLHQLTSFIKLSKVRIWQGVPRKLMNGNEMMVVLSPVDSCLPSLLSADPVLHELDSQATVNCDLYWLSK